MTQLIPQIPAGVAESLLSQLAHSRSADLDPGDELRIPQAITQPTGGMPITDALLKELRVSIVSSARNHGFPDSRPTSFLRFELEVAEALAAWSPLWIEEGAPTGEALRNDCWTFITIVVLPDVALWRWPSKGGEDGSGSRSWKVRMLGGSRNTFQRIFRRVMCLDRGAEHPDRWGLIRELQEDDFSAILERPGLSSNRDVAVCLGEEFLAMNQRLSQFSKGNRVGIYRQATKAIRAYGVVQPLDLLSTEQRETLIRSAFLRYEGDLAAAAEVHIGSETGTQAQQELTRKQVRKSFLKRILEGG